jgi:hypothetical protein
MGLAIRASAAVGDRRLSFASRGSAARPRPRLLAFALAATVAAAACALNQEGVPPPKNEIYYPGGALVDSTGDWLYVANSNSDLRYNDGTLVVVDLASAGDDYQKPSTPWPACSSLQYVAPTYAPPVRGDSTTHHCCWDVLDPETLNCDSRNYVDPDATVRIGSFAAAMVFNPRTTCHGKTTPLPCIGQLLVSARGNTSITEIDTEIDPAVGADNRRFFCSDDRAPFAECAANYRVTERVPVKGVDPPPPNDANKIILPEEPYALAMNGTDDVTDMTKTKTQLLVGHLRGGAISLVDISQPTPTLIGYYGALVPADSNGLRGITSLLRHGGQFFAGSRYVPRVMGVVTTGQDNGMTAEVLDNIAIVDSGEQYVSSLPGSETRGIQFVPPVSPTDPFAGEEAFVLQRVPPALLRFEVNNPLNQAPVDVIETCNSPTFIDHHGTGVTFRLYVTCFEDGEVYVFDPHVPRLVDIIEVGRGPAGLAFPPSGSKYEDKYVYVVGFGANNISVVDIEAGSPTENHVVQRIGYPSPVPR